MKKLINLLAIIGFSGASTNYLISINNTKNSFLKLVNINTNNVYPPINSKPQLDIINSIDEDSYVGSWSKSTCNKIDDSFNNNEDLNDVILPWIKNYLINWSVTDNTLKNSLIYAQKNWNSIKTTINGLLNSHNGIEFIYSNNTIHDIRAINDTQFSYSETNGKQSSYEYDNALTLSYIGFKNGKDFLNSKSTFKLDRTFEVYTGNKSKWHEYNTDFKNSQSVSSLKSYLNNEVTLFDYRYYWKNEFTQVKLKMWVTDDTKYKDLEVNFSVYLLNNNWSQNIGAKMY